MTGQELVNLFTSFMDDEDLGDTFILQLLNIGKDEIEMERPWMKLKKPSTDFSFASTDDYDDMKTLPSDFLMTYGDKPLKLISGNDILELSEIPLEERDQNRDNPELFYINHNSEEFAILGGLSKSYTGTLYYIGKTSDITLTTSWSFPVMAHPLLVIKALILQRGEIDFDEINARMVNNGYATYERMQSTLNMWDSMLQKRSMRGRKRKDLFKRSSN